MSSTHLIIPDIQDCPGAPKDHLTWIGKYMLDRQPDKIICLGDFVNMDSLSSYDRGKKAMEGRRYRADVESGVEAMATLMKPLTDYNAQKRRNKEAQYKPELHMTLGNHEERILRAANDNAQLDGVLSIDDLKYKEYGWTVHPFLDIVNLDSVNYCLAPHHKVLKRNLSYVALGDVTVGDELLGFDEEQQKGNHGRHYKTSVVEKVNKDRAELFRVTLSSGKTFDVTEDHRWLARYKHTTSWHWVTTRDLTCNHVIPKLFNVFSEDTSYEAGWLAGMFDGEGCLSRPNGAQGGIQLGVAQKRGMVLDKLLRILDSWGVGHKEHHNEMSGVSNVRILGSSSDKLELLGKIRCERLIAKFQPEALGRVQRPDKWALDGVVSVESIGVGEIVKIQTSTKTMIVDGYPHHNCHYFYRPKTGKPYGGAIDSRLKNIGFTFTQGHEQGKLIGTHELADGTVRRGLVVGSCYLYNPDYLGPQATSAWRGVIVKYEVQDGNYDLMEVSLDYLCRKYEQCKLDTFMKEKYNVRLY